MFLPSFIQEVIFHINRQIPKRNDHIGKILILSYHEILFSSLRLFLRVDPELERAGTSPISSLCQMTGLWLICKSFVLRSLASPQAAILQVETQQCPLKSQTKEGRAGGGGGREPLHWLVNALL